ncbi:MAG TPA: thioredoxin [Chthoniobacteraceae bacterium]|jgi:thioredoxin|nr:trxA [Chthoniobacter sp.]HEV7866062.1 thioredoxin [Chthoniobacteraceae bacterium]
MNEPININAASFEKAVLQSPIPVLVDFWAPWCGPCKMIAPVLDQIAKEGAGRFRIAKVNVDDEPALMQRFAIRGIPALLFFSGGELRHQIAGLAGKKVIVDQLTALESVAAAG